MLILSIYKSFLVNLASKLDLNQMSNPPLSRSRRRIEV